MISVLVITGLIICPVICSSAFDDSVIVEKNLFSPDREKWVMPPKGSKTKKKSKRSNKNVNDIQLSGTIVSAQIKSAILTLISKRSRRGKRSRKRSSRRNHGETGLYMEGDYMSGYFVKEIQESSVILHDDTENKDYQIFLHASNKDRTAVKTEIKEVSKRISADNHFQKKKNRGKKRRRIVTTPAETGLMLRKRLDQSLKILDRKHSRLVMKQANIDLKKLKKVFPHMSRKDKRDFRKNKKRLLELKKKYSNK